MAIIRLQHDRRLGYPGAGRQNLPPLPEAVVAQGANATVLTFRPLPRRCPATVRRKLHAGQRLHGLPDTDLLCYSLESDSPLAPLLLWDAAHGMAVGRSITLAGDQVRQCYLLRAYYRGALVVERQDAHAVVLRKVAQLPAEKDQGRNAWSFCIPVGPEDATLLNVTVRRILELDLPHKEILLCGRPADNFLHWDQVRIVGEDITAPPVRICAKKNRLALEARHENLCILHDRVFLPGRFAQAVDAFGECYPLTTFQSLYFDDRYNLVPRRYSDFGTSQRIDAMNTLGVMRDNDVTRTSPFSPAVLALTDKVEYFYGNALRYTPNHYPTGSLYLVKRSVWLACPQNENLMWAEFEDLEHARRAEAMGIPSRINPHALTQSMIARPLLSTHGAVFFESCDGAMRRYRPPFEALPIPRKPLIKLLHETARRGLAQFSARHVPAALATPLSAGATMSSRQRLGALVQLTHRSKVPLQRNALVAMLGDYERLLAFDQMPYVWREHTLAQFLLHGSGAVAELVGQSDILINHASLRPRRAVFADSLLDYLPRAGCALYLGSAIAALSLAARNGSVLYFPKGWLGCLRGILDSTPFSHYAEAPR